MFSLYYFKSFHYYFFLALTFNLIRMITLNSSFENSLRDIFVASQVLTCHIENSPPSLSLRWIWDFVLGGKKSPCYNLISLVYLLVRRYEDQVHYPNGDSLFCFRQSDTSIKHFANHFNKFYSVNPDFVVKILQNSVIHLEAMNLFNARLF